MKTVSLETAKLLKEAGFLQESYFFWWKCQDHKPIDGEVFKLHFQGNERNKDYMDVSSHHFDYYAAPIAEEILERLPERIEGYKTLGMGKSMGEWLIGYQKIGNELQAIRLGDISLSEAAGKVYLYLIREGLLKNE